MSDWYKDGMEEFMFDGPLFSGVTPESFKKVYDYLTNVGLIDYDTEKEFIREQYVDD